MDYYKVAVKAAKNSKCEKRKVGAVVVGAGHHAVACNHTNGVEVPCEFENGETNPAVIHAEIAALKEFATMTEYRPETIYVTHEPCENCRQAILEAGIEPDCIYVVDSFLKFDELKPALNLLPASAKHFIPDLSLFNMYFAVMNSNDLQHGLINIGTNLLNHTSLLDVATVLAHGAKKYKPNNWRKVDDLGRYWAALGRHLIEVDKDPKSLDTEWNLTHAAHALTNVLFLLELIEKD